MFQSLIFFYIGLFMSANSLNTYTTNFLLSSVIKEPFNKCPTCGDPCCCLTVGSGVLIAGRQGVGPAWQSGNLGHLGW